jgi:hypothetical protein
MGALTIAFDTIIVGALALPWVYLVLHLFFFAGEVRFLRWFGVPDERQSEEQKKQKNAESPDGKWTNNQLTVAAVSILLFAATYTLGSSIERVAQDFFNDDDLRIPWIFRMTITEDRIIAHVYCESDESLLMPSATPSPALKRRFDSFWGPNHQKPEACQAMLNGFGSHASFKTGPNREDRAQKDLKKLTWDIFGIEENGLLLKGEDDTLRLRQLHDQIVVLRGAAFNCLIAGSLCLFAWGVKAKLKNHKKRGILMFVPVVFLVFSALAVYDHFHVEQDFDDPPYMEFSLLAIGGVGVFMLWLKRWPKLEGSETERPLAAKEQSSETKAAGWKPRALNTSDGCFLRWKWGMMSFVFAFLFAAGVLGWWATEVLYVQQVIYSYNSPPPSDSTSK